MMVLVNSRTPPEEESVCGGIATLQINTLRFGSFSVRPTATTTTIKSGEELKDADVTGEARGETGVGA